MIIAFDPGEVNGVAIGNAKGELISMKQYTWNEFPHYLNNINSAEQFIVEEFRIRPDKAMSFSFSDMKTIQAIGMIRLRAYQLSTPVTYQRPLDKTMGYRWAGTAVPKNHSISHQVDAYAHLVFHWVHHLGLKPPAAARLTPLDSVSKAQ